MIRLDVDQPPLPFAGKVVWSTRFVPAGELAACRGFGVCLEETSPQVWQWLDRLTRR